MDRKKKILYIDFGGLGDHLSFSTLPETCHNNGFDFYLSSRSKIRSPQTLELIWKLNPFFKGVTDEEPNCGHNNYTNLEGYNDELSLNKNMEEKIGFPESDLPHNSKYPIIYRQPNLIEDFKDCLLIDLNGTHFANHGYTYNWVKIKELIEADISKNNYNNVYFIKPSAVNYSNASFDFTIGESINVKDIFEYSDMIYSAKKIYTIWAGGSHLGSAIKWKYKPELEIKTFSDNTTKSCFWYDNVNYLRGYMINAPFK